MTPEFPFDNPNVLDIQIWMYLTFGSVDLSVGITDGYVTSAVDPKQGIKLYRDDSGKWAIEKSLETDTPK